jgi:hypothetical protein
MAYRLKVLRDKIEDLGVAGDQPGTEISGSRYADGIMTTVGLLSARNINA